MSFLFTRSALRKAIERGLTSGKLKEELCEFEDLSLSVRQDAEAVCWGLQQVGGRNSGRDEMTYALALMFQQIANPECDAIETLRERGIPELIKLFDLISCPPNDEDADTRLFILKILALYGTTEGALKIIEAAHQALRPDSYMWSVILGVFEAGHPQNRLVYSSLAEPLPQDFIGVALLDAANAALMGGESFQHPFDNDEGIRRLRAWLTNPEPEEHSYAHSATAALTLIGHPERDALLEIALSHPDKGVRMEADWAAAKLGRESGLERLVEDCRDFQTAEAATRYLTELGREDLVPVEAKEPGFAALAEFARWCAHPNELGRAPDALEIVDQRELRWPPEGEPKPFWLIKYTVRDTTGLEEDEEECGVVGSVTFCLFSYNLAQRPPEDAYGVHCYWEMEQKGLIEETAIQPEEEDYSGLLSQWTGAALEHARIRFVAELAPELKQPGRLVGLAAAQLKGEPGWVVLDGPRSQWYPQAEQPEGSDACVVLKMHVGRQLLGFSEQPDRTRYLAEEKPARSPRQIVTAYERLLSKALSAESKQRQKALDYFGPLGKHFESYVESLVRLERSAEVRRLVRLFSPYWDDPSGMGTLGTGAFKAGHWDLAEQFLLKYRNETSHFERGAEMTHLARVWCSKGKREQARKLLTDCLKRLLEDSRLASEPETFFYEQVFQIQRSTFLNLFPGEEGFLAARSIPGSTLRT